MTTYFVTGGTGFIGRRLVARLLDRAECDTVYVLVRPGLAGQAGALAQTWPRPGAVVGIQGDLAEPGSASTRPTSRPTSITWCTWAPCTT